MEPADVAADNADIAPSSASCRDDRTTADFTVARRLAAGHGSADHDAASERAAASDREAAGEGATATLDGRMAWRALGSLGAETDGAAHLVREIADQLPELLTALASSEATASPASGRAGNAAEFAASATRLFHAAERLQIAAASLVIAQKAERIDHARTSRHWLARHCGTSHSEASRWCRVAEVCDRYPAIGQAFWSGDITAAHADACSRIVPSRFSGETLSDAIEQVRSVDDLIADTARRSSVEEFSQFCRRLRDRLDADGPNDPGAEPSKIWLHQTFNGRWSLTGDLTPDDGAILATILADLQARDAATNDRQTSDDEPTAEPTSDPASEPASDPASEPTSDPASESASEPASAATSSSPPEPDPADAAQRRSRLLIDALLAANGLGRRGRAGIYVHVDIDQFQRESPDTTDPPNTAHPPGAGPPAGSSTGPARKPSTSAPHAPPSDPPPSHPRGAPPPDPTLAALLAGRTPAHTEAGLDLSDDSLWALLAGADVTPIFTSEGRPLSFGRTRRLAPPILRRVIAHRDRTCRFPGCDRPPVWTDAHHIVHWDDDGPTDPANLAGVCRFHHHSHHLGRFTMGGDANVELTIAEADGAPHDPTPRYLRGRRPDPNSDQQRESDDQ